MSNTPIKFSVRKLNRYADRFFENVDFYKRTPEAKVTTDFIEREALAGIALRRWATQLKEERRLARVSARLAKRNGGAR